MHEKLSATIDRNPKYKTEFLLKSTLLHANGHSDSIGGTPSKRKRSPPPQSPSHGQTSSKIASIRRLTSSAPPKHKVRAGLLSRDLHVDDDAELAALLSDQPPRSARTKAAEGTEKRLPPTSRAVVVNRQQQMSDDAALAAALSDLPPRSARKTASLAPLVVAKKEKQQKTKFPTPIAKTKLSTISQATDSDSAADEGKVEEEEVVEEVEQKGEASPAKKTKKSSTFRERFAAAANNAGRVSAISSSLPLFASSHVFCLGYRFEKRSSEETTTSHLRSKKIDNLPNARLFFFFFHILCYSFCRGRLVVRRRKGKLLTY